MNVQSIHTTIQVPQVCARRGATCWSDFLVRRITFFEPRLQVWATHGDKKAHSISKCWQCDRHAIVQTTVTSKVTSRTLEDHDFLVNTEKNNRTK